MLAYSIRTKPVITPLASRCISRSPTGITLITLNLILPRTILRLTNRKVWRGCTLTPGSCRHRISSDTGSHRGPRRLGPQSSHPLRRRVTSRHHRRCRARSSTASINHTCRHRPRSRRRRRRRARASPADPSSMRWHRGSMRCPASRRWLRLRSPNSRSAQLLPRLESASTTCSTRRKCRRLLSGRRCAPSRRMGRRRSSPSSPPPPRYSQQEGVPFHVQPLAAAGSSSPCPIHTAGNHDSPGDEP